ncbi:hypothetical protein LF25067_p00011 (plasmid) [Limosilactobacillus fermentum]|nr:hypothetical protein LF25067_p00011 [Limosilactobacillus fermentum]
MSQWILVALFLLAHPLMMLFMHKGMHGGSGSMGGCGNNTQQNSIILKSHVKKSINLGIYYMKILTGSRGDEVHEHLYENGQRRVGHRILKKIQ